MFNTLLYAKRLESAGFKRHQAEKQIQVMTEMIVDGVATKQDLELLEARTSKEFAVVNSEINTVRAEMASEFAAVRSEMASEFVVVRSELLQMESRLTIKIGGIMGTVMAIGIGIIGIIVK